MQVKFLKLGALKLQDISFSNFMTFCFGVSAFGFSLKVPINATRCSHRLQIAWKEARSVMAENNLLRNGETSRVTKNKKMATKR